MKFLLDANLSHKTAENLQRDFSIDCVSLMTIGMAGLDDKEVVVLAKRENRIIITLDLDFGKLYHDPIQKSDFGVIIIRTRDQSREHIETLIYQFFSKNLLQEIFAKNPFALAVIEDTVTRTIL